MLTNPFQVSPISEPNQIYYSKMFRSTTATTAFVNKAQRLNYEGDVKVKVSLPPYTYGGLRGTSSPLPPVKAFCKVCHDAGKPESIYTSHFVRASPAHDAPVVCPTLLAQPCRYCSVPGHTVKYCPALMKEQVVNPVAPLPKQKEETIVKQDYLNSVNSFAALALSDDESDDDDKEEIVSHIHKEDEQIEEVTCPSSPFDELNNLSKDALFSLLDAVLQLNPTSDNKLVIAIEKAITKNEKQSSNPTTATAVRPPFCSPRPTPMKPIIPTQQSKAWADYEDDEEMDYNVDVILNFPPLPAPANKRTYADMLKN